MPIFVVELHLMSIRTKEEATAPLGVIGCLTAGFEVVGRNLWLVILPVLIDLLLWLGPRLSMAPLFQEFVDALRMQPAADAEMARQLAQAAELAARLGEQFNLLSVISGLPLLTVPSLLAQHALGTSSPLGGADVLFVNGLLLPMVWSLGLTLIGLVLGIVYLSGLARRVHAMRPSVGRDPDSGDAEGAARATREWSTVGKYVRALVFGAGLLAVGTFVVPLWLLLVGLTVAFAPPLGFVVWLASTGLGSYIVLHLMFVVHGVLLGGRGLLRAIWESAALIHSQLLSVIGLIVLVLVIYEGLGFVWSLPSGDSWALLIGILGNACIATGLTAATFVFYQERIEHVLSLLKSRRASART